jgi:tRNA uridine 5-carboxymethylaminomethyl modification enzyme
VRALTTPSERDSQSEAAGASQPASLPELDPDTATEIELRAKYAGYIRKEELSIQRALRMEESLLPDALNFRALSGLRSEARQQLERVHPRTLGQASRIPGVTPADISILLVHLERMRHARRGATPVSQIT